MALSNQGGSIDFHLLQILHVLLETRGPTAAARKLGVSQPSVSRALARLRVAFEDPLLVRRLGGMVLTPRAEALREPLARWLADGQALLRTDTSPAQLERTFHVASTDYGIISVIAPALAQLNADAPGVSLSVSPLTIDSTRQLNEGSLDLVVTGIDPDLSAFHARHLFRETHTCMARPGHPLNRNHPISLDDFLRWPHVVVTVLGQEADRLAITETCEFSRRIVLWTPGFAIAPLLVRGSDALVTLPTRAAQQLAPAHGLETFEPPVDLAPFDYWLVWHERSNRDPATLWLIDQLAAQFSEAAR